MWGCFGFVCVFEYLFDEFVVSYVEFFVDDLVVYVVYLFVVYYELLYGGGEFVFFDVEDVGVYVVW